MGNGPRGRISGALLLIAALTRTLEAESDRLSLWIPVRFASGILIYFSLPEEPRLLSAAALVMAATGIYFAARGTGLGLVVGDAALAGAQDVSVFWRGLRKLWSIAIADVPTTLVATAAVAPFAIYHFHGFTASTTGCSPRARSPRRGLPHRRYRHRAVQRRQRVQHGSGGGRPRGAVDQERKRGRDARTEALGAGACQVEAVSIGWSGLCRDPGASDDDDDDDDAKHRLFDGNPDE